MDKSAASVLPFALSDRWIVTVQSEWQLVRVRHRMRWFAVARRTGHPERRYWCASREDAVGIAEIVREGFIKMEEARRLYELCRRAGLIPRHLSLVPGKARDVEASGKSSA